jgi:hypothetical protein
MLRGTKRNFNNFVIARLPDNFVLYDGGGPSNPRYTFIPSEVKSHVELYGTKAKKYSLIGK